MEKGNLRKYILPQDYQPFYHRNGFTHLNLCIINMDESEKLSCNVGLSAFLWIEGYNRLPEKVQYPQCKIPDNFH